MAAPPCAPPIPTEARPVTQQTQAAQAAVDRATAARDLAQKRFDRVARASQTSAVSELDVKIASAELAETEAAIAQATAELEKARINQSYTLIAAPVTGRMSRLFVDPGNFVGTGGPTHLATLIDDSTMHAYFEVPERIAIQYFEKRDNDEALQVYEKPIRLKLADGAALERTLAVMEKVEKIIASTEGTPNYVTITGFSILDVAAAANTGFAVVTFKNWSERGKKSLHQDAIIQSVQQKLFSIQEAGAFAFAMPSLPGVGVSGGFTFMLQDKEGAGLDQLQAVAGELIATANADPSLAGVNTTFRASVPQIYVDIDREQVKRTGTSMTEVFSTMQVHLGSAYVNDFTLFDRVFKVIAQADAPFRDQPGDVNALHVRGADGRMIPLGAVAELKDILGPQNITRFNMLPAVKILGGPAPGGSSGEAMTTKTAILLTEFAKLKRGEGMSIFDSAVESVRLRFRAVMMTALSFILGVFPLLIASGAGAESRKILGTAVFGGMLFATAISLAAVPMLYFIVQKITERLRAK